MSTRRKFLAGSAGAIAGALASVGSGAAETTGRPSTGEIADLCGEWLFRTDLANLGTKNNWYGENLPGKDWRPISVPHTWQVEAHLADYRGVAWYWRSFYVPAKWRGRALRVEVYAVFHTATDLVDGPTGRGHARQGYYGL